MRGQEVLRVLVAPSHALLSEVTGSEPIWACNIISRLARDLNVQIDAICGKNAKVVFPPNVRCFEVGFDKGDLINRGLFYLRCFTMAKKLYKNADLIHHMFPFGYKAGFNPLAIFGYLRNKPYVIGPIQYPQEYSDVSDYMWVSGKMGAKAEMMYGLESFTAKSLSGLIRVLHETTLEEAEALVFDSKKTLKLYSNLYSDLLRDKLLKVIPPGVETEVFKYAPPIKKGYLEIMTAGYLLKRKGIQRLIEAMPLVLREFKNVRLRIVGDGPFKQELMRLVRRLSLNDVVSFEGLVARNELVNYYIRCDVYVQPSLSEGFPSTIMEAMSVGRPVIASNVGCIGEYLINGVSGFLIPKESNEAIADKICTLISNEDLRLNMGVRARAYAEANFDWNRLIAMWYNVYEKLV